MPCNDDNDDDDNDDGDNDDDEDIACDQRTFISPFYDLRIPCKSYLLVK